jgi:hypothetical protein
MMTTITTSTDDIDTEGVPNAHLTRWYKCESCKNLHVVLCDKDGVTFAGATFDKEMLEDMLKTIDGEKPRGH